MVLSSIDLWQRIASEGLASPMQCRSWAAEAAKSMSAGDSTDGIKILQRLIEIGKLTNYQAKILAGQSEQPLHRGDWSILRRVKEPLWEGWFEVTKVDLTKADQTQPTWARWLAPEELLALRSSAPSLPRGLRLAAIERHPHLQSVRMPILSDGELQLHVAPVGGKLLSECFREQRPSLDQATRIVNQVAAALAALHSQGLVHGRVFPDRIYLQDEQATLISDPIASLTATLDRSAVGLLGARLGSLQPEQFLAPEFVAPGQLPTCASDVYSLGCTWRWLLTGQPPADGETPQQILARQTEVASPLPSDCDYPAPLARCLQHSLAKNLDARFASAVELHHAFTIAQQLAHTGPQPTAGHSRSAPATSSATSISTEPVRTEATPMVSQTSTPAPAATNATANDSAAPKPKGTKAKPTDAKPNDAKRIEQSAAVAPASGATSPRRKPAVPLVSAEVVQPPEAQPAPTTPSTPSAPTAKATSHPTPSVPTATVPSATVPSATVPSATVPSATVPSATVPTATTPTATTPTATTPTATTPTATTPTATTPTATTPTTATIASATTAPSRRVRRRRRSGNRWLLPTIGGCGFLILLLLILKLSGALEPRQVEPLRDSRAGGYTPLSTEAPTVVERDPRLEKYQLVEANADRLWVPPALPAPIDLDLLPPGGQLFISIRPADLMRNQQSRKLIAAMDSQLSPWLAWIGARAGQPLETIQQVTVACYGAEPEGGMPQTALRVQLAQPRSLSQLKEDWQQPTAIKVGDQELLVDDKDLATYVSAQPLVDSQSVTVFSRGPVELMRQVAEQSGSGGPLIAPMETLWQRSDQLSDASLLISPRYLFAEGRGLLSVCPPRLRDQLQALLRTDSRAALLQTRLQPQWYVELQIIALADRDAPQVVKKLEESLSAAPSTIEQWFVEQPPHPHWRALAIRFPQMLRVAGEYTRFGVEGGVAWMNAYLPADAAPNLALASWIAMQEGATMTGESMAAQTAPNVTAAPLTNEQYLDRPIRVSFDQESIEVALRLIGEEANAGLPAGTPPRRFLLDGSAFEKAGITRNQQVREFSFDGKPVRDALTELARRGNPVTTVSDTREPDQKLIWVVADDPQSDGQQLISLTTRDAATAANIPLPTEFAPQ